MARIENPGPNLFRSLMALVVLILSSIALAQDQGRLPTDTELHAAACNPMMQWGVDIGRQMVAGYDKEITAIQALPPDQQGNLAFFEKARRDAAQKLAESESALNRLRAYLLPRWMSLDAFAMLEATERGKADIQSLSAIADRCDACQKQALAKANPGPGPPKQLPEWLAMSVCGNECGHQPVQDRFESCRNPTWLPF
jgi:hypothetical protein